jgi:hypothetical protein
MYTLSEHSVREFQLHALMGWEIDSTDLTNTDVYRLDLYNIWFYFPEVYLTMLLFANILVYQNKRSS